ncbi:hypothetical protein LMH87_007497 [Akanthomyces muscarius]|uniref:Uncharacterized protein n=1 Tax=Akanthomyces muscarius TaxID=2231603 RepID=A0A9W8QT76_AKAMU|nr:hypothetical protein LMH87_007497 [Akanthomyces muscarius]KAJ4165887.1 hypothetical protein LMH87_007497 [Akanthomyces muscarius]
MPFALFNSAGDQVRISHIPIGGGNSTKKQNQSLGVLQTSSSLGQHTNSEKQWSNTSVQPTSSNVLGPARGVFPSRPAS